MSRHRLIGSLVVREEPEWILSIEADELMEDRFIRERDSWLDTSDYDVIAAKLGLRAKHFGYMRRTDRLRKYHRYILHDPDPERTYAHLLDEAAHLERWED